jgi:hypothetical protein
MGYQRLIRLNLAISRLRVYEENYTSCSGRESYRWLAKHTKCVLHCMWLLRPRPGRTNQTTNGTQQRLVRTGVTPDSQISPSAHSTQASWDNAPAPIASTQIYPTGKSPPPYPTVALVYSTDSLSFLRNWTPANGGKALVRVSSLC